MLSFETNQDRTLNYKHLIGSILPRPIAWVSTLNKSGTYNLAPFSFFTAISVDPMIIAFCPIIHSQTGSEKDTLINIKREKEFVVNFCTEELTNQVNLTAADLNYGVSEFEHAKLTPLESEKVKPPRVKESPIHYECVLRDLLSYGSEKGNGTLIAGEVLKVHIEESIYHQGRINTDKYSPIGRGAGNDWIRCKDRIQLERA